ncbi:DUF1835 domain-containing protein [Variovorax saccharolyticus]|uniref:DUF1835 domain-containing protein n=1 Tax=Variovorax saccharolyticus TaxID=3053516 RepID=UPI0025774A6B|nr:DUF1835 domain-containing protein [Variovorax sp. J31P216]MDM0023941.1 DUF1835 domain-containing protein [Variovorax sp. J31P216]
MPSEHRSSAHSGHINLEQQRKRAKELLVRLKDGSALAELALLARQAPLPAAPRLADAQWLIAREHGFASWPRLKAHADAVDFAARHPSFAADDEAGTQHWRCGNDIAHSLQLAGFRGEFHMFADPLCMGPAPELPEAEFLALRSTFVSSAFGMPIADAQRRMQDEYRGLARIGEARRAVLWCDADAYDQLFLIAVLAGLTTPPEKLELIEVDRIPSVERFIGIGQLAPDLLAWLWPQRRPLGADALALARRAWKAYRAPSPEAWAAIAAGATPSLPFLAPALRRQLQELPSLRDGLSLSERLVLQIVDELGRPTLGQVFAESHGHREPLPFLGDLMFHVLVRALIDAPAPLLREFDAHLDWPRRPLELTALGRRILAGEACWTDHAAAARWVGGVRIEPGRPHWAIDERLVPRWRSSGAR